MSNKCSGRLEPALEWEREYGSSSGEKSRCCIWWILFYLNHWQWTDVFPRQHWGALGFEYNNKEDSDNVAPPFPTYSLCWTSFSLFLFFGPFSCCQELPHNVCFDIGLDANALGYCQWKSTDYACTQKRGGGEARREGRKTHRRMVRKSSKE